ncbi:MAG TPA: hypothetical protein VK891_02630 [Euzebyales bacterium]|nr:hypothetical protein [Euzebyales bacterium]
MPGSVENLVVGVASSAVTAVIVWVWARVARLRRRHRRAAFFGLSPGDRCVIVMNRAARDDRAMHHDDVEGLVDLIRLVDEIGAEPEVVRFDRLLEPAGETAEVCIGGPTSNERAEVHLRTYLPGVTFRTYDPDADDHMAIITGDDLFPYERAEIEHALLARFYPESSPHPVILVCGQSARSNRAAISYLARHYERAIRVLHPDGEPFCLVLALRSPLVYGVRSVHLVKDVTTSALRPPPAADGAATDAAATGATTAGGTAAATGATGATATGGTAAAGTATAGAAEAGADGPPADRAASQS